MEAKGQCERTRCSYPHKGKYVDNSAPTARDDRKYQKMETNVISKESKGDDNNDESLTAVTTERTRYFDDSGSGSNMMESSDNQMKLSHRILHKIDKMKANLNFCTGNATPSLGYDTNAAAALENSTQNDDFRMETNEGDVIDKSVGKVEDDDDVLTALPRKRPKLGKLPSYIPLD